MRFVPVLLAVACLCLISGMAAAHDDEYSADENHNGYLEVYRSSNYHGGWHHYRVVANRKLRNHAPNEPRIRMVWRKAKAELWIHKVEMEGRHCAGHSEEVPNGLDWIVTDASCPDPAPRLISHEMGHIYGLPDGPVGDGSLWDSHHRCTDYWQERSINVGETAGDGIPGCAVRITGFGPHDLRALRR